MEGITVMTVGQIAACAVSVIAVSAVVMFGLSKLLKGRNLKTPIISITEAEKERIQSDSRELSDNQMRTAKIHVGSIRLLLITEAEKKFPGMSSIESAYMALLAGRITDNLLEQFRIDLVRNHITKKTDEELQVYTRAKASTYYTKVKLFLCDYNSNLPEYDLKTIMDGIPFKEIYDIYYESYLSAKQLSAGY